ncbi:MAG: efflux RND transporter permease subunit [Chitinophagales bacterium]|nr:efflux RND transporter permease subunit [Chitinophagales bacterium]
MNIAQFSVKNYQFTLVVFLALFSMGVYSLLNMPRSEDPVFNAPQYFIVAVYPGTSPKDIEELVVDPMEKRISELNDIKKIVTDINDGVAVIGVYYKYESDVEEKYQEIVREVNSLKANGLPQDLYSLDIIQAKSSDVNIYQYALVSENASYKKLADEAEKLTDELEKNKSLKKVKVWGYPEQRINVELNIEKIAQYKIPLNRIMGAIQSENVNIPAGSININSKKFNVKTTGKYNDIEQVKNTIVSSSGGAIVHLKDIANVSQDYQEQKHISRANGHRSIFITAAQKEGQNIMAVNASVVPVVERFQKELPKNIKFVTLFDQHEGVAGRLNHFMRDFGIAIFLVLITLLPLGFRASVVVMISIPLSLAIGLTLLNFTGFNINQLSIVGFIVALGLLVDDSIVVVENIERFLRNGYNRKEASILATNQISLAVLGCTVTLIFAFLPLVFLPEGSGDFIRSLPMAVILTIIASLLVSLTIVPFLSSTILSNHENPEGNIFMRGLKRIIHGSYAVFLDKALKNPVWTLVVALAIFAGSLTLIPTIGFSLFPTSEKPMFMINITTPEGTNIYETDRIVKFVESKLHKHEEIRSIASNTGRGNPRVYYNEIPRNEAENYGQLLVILQKETETREKKAFIDKLREEFKAFPNAKIEVKDFEQGPPIDAPISVRIFGDNLDSLRILAAQVEQIFKATPGTIYIKNPLSLQGTDLRVQINKEKAGMLGIPIAEANRAIRLAIAGLDIGSFQDENNDEQVIHLTLPKTEKVQSFDVFKRLYINSVTGASVPLNQIADIQFETSPTSIRHFDKNRYVAVSAFAKTGFLSSNINQQIDAKLKDFKFQDGYGYQMAGEVESAQESFGGLGTIILITVFGFVGVLILEFKSFKSTLIVLSVIPLGIIGAIFMLLIVGYPFSFVAVIGLIALVGIEVKNTILLVDFTNQLREQGKSIDEAIREAGEIRFVPIVLTSLTAIGGLMPLALEGNPLYSPLAWVLIGGLISSTLLSRLVTPVLYKLLPPKVEPQSIA